MYATVHARSSEGTMLATNLHMFSFPFLFIFFQVFLVIIGVGYISHLPARFHKPLQHKFLPKSQNQNGKFMILKLTQAQVVEVL